MQVPYLDLPLQYQSIKIEIQQEINKVLDSGAYILGPAVSDFEKKFALFCQARHAIGVNSGTSALHLALLALGIGPGDEVIIPAMSFLATAAAVCYTGATPVPVDIDPESYCINPTLVKSAITSRTRAVLPVHLYGQSADMDALAAIAAEYNLFLLEDAAQAHGAEYKSRRCGSLGCIAGFSFYPGKNLGAYGEGGAVVTNDDKLAEKIRMLRDWGAKERYQHILPGYNYRMDGIQGAVLGVKMRYIEQWNEKRRLAAAVYLDLLSGITGLHLPQEMKYARHVYHVFALRHDRRDELAKYLTASGIASGIHYPLPLHLQECYKDWGYRAGDFPVAENLSATELSLPIYPEITGKQLESVAAALRTFNPA